MGFFSGDGVAIDLGTANTTVYLEGRGVALREPTSVLVLADDPASVVAVGDDAFEMFGRTDEETRLFSPVLDGAVTDVDMATLLVLALCEKAMGRRKPLEKSALLVSMSQGATKVERDALMRAAHLTGAKRCVLVKTPLAAAVGAGLHAEMPRGAMVCVLGAGVVEIAVLSMGAIVAARSMRSGGLSMDEAVVRYLRREKGVLIGLATAEDLKCDIGAARAPADDDADEAEEPVLLKGRDVSSGKPKTVPVTSADIAAALTEPISILTDALSDALSRVPPDLAGDIAEQGICLCGGGALLPGLTDVLAEKTGVPVFRSEHPHEDVIMGLAMLADDERLLRMAMDGGAAEE